MSKSDYKEINNLNIFRVDRNFEYEVEFFEYQNGKKKTVIVKGECENGDAIDVNDVLIKLLKEMSGY